MTLHQPLHQPAASEPTAAPQPAPVVVVGAGLSGLVAANLLERLGLDAVLLEARERVGGRVLGQAAAGGQHRYDLGPAWVWPEVNHRLAAWLGALDLPLFEQQGPGAVLVELPSQAVRRHATGYTQQPPSMRVGGGTASLTDALRARLLRTPVLLGTRVHGLAAGAAEPGGPDSPIAVEFEQGGQAGTLAASAVILALPPRLLASTLRWSPVLPAGLSQGWADAPTWMAGHAKLLAIYPSAFWRAAGLSGSAVSQAGPLAEVHDASAADGRQAALFGFVGLTAAGRRRLGRQALVDAALTQLARLFGPAALTPQSVHLQDWADEAATATAADAQPDSVHPALLSTVLPAPWCDHVHLAGSEFAPDFPGYLEGAVQAAERAVGALQARRQALRRVVPAIALAAALGLLPGLADSAAAAPLPVPLQVPDTLAQRAKACTGCHGPQGRATPQGYTPRIAGKPAGYLRAQLLAFRDGRRPHDGMARLLVNLPDDYVGELAGHFAAQQVNYPAPSPGSGSAASRALGQRLVQQGDAGRELPACVSCHGAAMTGVAPAIPGLLGLPRDYLVGQLGAWRQHLRQARAPDCMAALAQRLQPTEIAAVADWLAAQALPADSGPAAGLPAALPLACGSTQP